MAGIAFVCSNCNAEIECDAALAGNIVECPHCRTSLTVPIPGIHEGILLGGFRLEHKLGAGAMGEVWLCNQESMERKVAVKILSPALTHDPDYIEQFLREVRNTGRLEHKNIVTAFDAGESDGMYYLAMSYVEGESLEEKIQREGKIPEAKALKIIRDIAQALDYAWKNYQLIHRDIKPSNIMLDRNDDPQLMDMGVSKSLSEDPTLTMSGTILGTPHYISPEQARADVELDCRTDIFSLGATLYNMVTGKAPFDSPTVMGVLTKLASDPIPPPQEENPELSDACIILLELMMTKSRDDRLQSWKEVVSEATRVLKGKMPQKPLPVNAGNPMSNSSLNISKSKVFKKPNQIQLPKNTNPSATAIPEQKNKSKAPVFIGVAVILLIAGGIGVFFLTQKKPPADVAEEIQVAEQPLESTPSTSTASSTTAEKPAAPENSVEVKQKEMWDFAAKFAKENPQSFGQAVALFEKIKSSCKGTKYELMAGVEITKLQKEQKRLEAEKLAKIADEKRKTEEARKLAVERKKKLAAEAAKTEALSKINTAMLKGDFSTAANQEGTEELGSAVNKIANIAKQLNNLNSAVAESLKNSVAKTITIGSQKVKIAKVENGVIYGKINTGKVLITRKISIAKLPIKEKLKHLDALSADAKAIYLAVLCLKNKKYDSLEKYANKIIDPDLAPLKNAFIGKIQELQVDKAEIEAQKDYRKIAGFEGKTVRLTKIQAQELLKDITTFRKKHQNTQFLKNKTAELDNLIVKANSSLETITKAHQAKTKSSKPADSSIALVSEVQGNSEFKKLKMGAPVFANKPSVTWKVLPPSLANQGLWVSPYIIAAKGGVTIKIKKPGIVYIGVFETNGGYVKGMTKKHGWQLVSTDLATTEGTYTLLKKNFNSDEKMFTPNGKHGIMVFSRH